MDDTKKVLSMLPFPSIVCDECYSYCVYHKYGGDSDDKSWLTCTNCKKEWHNIPDSSVSNQIKEVNSLIDGVGALTDKALKSG